MMSFFTLVALAARCIPRALLIFTPPMQRTFLTNLALLLVLNLLVKPFYLLGIDAGVQDAVGASAYGSYAALLSLSFLLNIVLDLGLTNYNTRNIAQHTHLMGKYLSGVIGVRMVLAGLYALLTVVVGLVLGYSGEQLGVLGWLVLNQALVASILYLRSNIAGAQRFRQDSLLSVLDRVLLIAAVGWLLWARGGDAPFRIEWFVWAQTAAYGTTLLVALVMTLRLSGKVRMGWNPTFSRVVLKQSFPYALLILLMTFYYRTDTLMLERMLPDGAFQAGIYAQGFRFFEAFNMIGYLFAGLLVLGVAGLLMLGAGEGAQAQTLMRDATRGAALGAVGGAIAGDAGKSAAMGAVGAGLAGGMRRANPNPQQGAVPGAARGAAVCAAMGAVGGDAGKGAAIGAAAGGLAGGMRRYRGY
jgi:hypothetical protein